MNYKFAVRWNKSPKFYRAYILSAIGLTKTAAAYQWAALTEDVKNLLEKVGVMA
jgi:hypothetical protein